MTFEILFALTTFAFVSSITPGPNNLMLMASGANYGFRRTLPHMLGVNIGHCLMIVLIGLGLIRLFELYPMLQTGMKIVSVVYLLYLAWKIGTAAAPGRGDAFTGKPLTFLQAAAFQWVNPKGWFMALTALSVYAPNQDLAAVLMVAAVFALVNLPSISTWTLLGTQVRRLLKDQRRLTVFNWSMATALVLSLALIL